MDRDESERREYARIRRAMEVRFKYISGTVKDPEIDLVYEGSTLNVSMGGLLLVGPIPRMEWLKDLLLGHIQVGVNLTVPLNVAPVKALTRLSWIEAREPQALTFRMGLRILDMPADHRRILSDFLSRETRIP